MKLRTFTPLTGACAIALALTVPQSVQAAPITFDDFNVNEGHFNQAPNFSGSVANVAASSTADRVTSDSPREGTGHERLVLNATTAGSALRCRFLSGGGTIANNTAFTTSAGEDGWIGLYVKTTQPDWTVQLWIESASVNGGIPKTVIADGEWHLYEWNLDDDTGGEDGWGSIAGVLSGSTVVADGNHTIDSVVFRHAAAPASATLFMDFIAKSSSGSVSNLLLDPCINTSGVLVNGPLATNSNQVLVAGAFDTATALTIYQDSGSGMTPIGTKTSGIVAGNNNVTVSGLIKGAKVSATQTVAGQESCVPTTGVLVGGGANPPVKIALTIREMTNTSATVGAPGAITGQTALHFLGATTVTGGAPMDAPVVYPSNGWQTVTFNRGTEIVGNPTQAAGAATDGGGYAANDSVMVQVYAYRTAPTNGVLIYSRAGALSSAVTSNDVFGVNWTWDAVPGADGYRLLRDVNQAGFNEGTDVVGTNFFSDAGTMWFYGTLLTPNQVQTGSSIQWNPTVGNANNILGQWGCLESINFVIADLTDTGPYDLYIDNLQNGGTVFQTFEDAVAGTLDYGFRAPSFSGTTSGAILTAPDVGAVSNGAADAGTKSFRVQFQWNNTTETKWLRLTTSGVSPASNPYVNLDEPISIRLLLLPVGATPVAPPRPALSIHAVGPDTVLNWAGGHRLQTSIEASGSYTNIPGVTLAPHTNTFTEPVRFFRLVN